MDRVTCRGSWKIEPYRDLGLCAHPIRKKIRFLGILGTDVSR